jgi:hypothetical protein
MKTGEKSLQHEKLWQKRLSLAWGSVVVVMIVLAPVRRKQYAIDM